MSCGESLDGERSRGKRRIVEKKEAVMAGNWQPVDGLLNLFEYMMYIQLFAN